MRGRASIFICFTLLLCAMIDPGSAALALAFLSLKGGLNPKLIKELSDFDSIVRANNEPFVSYDLAVNGALTPVNCLMNTSSPLCLEDQKKSCLNPDFYSIRNLTGQKDQISQLAALIHARCGREALSTKTLEINVQNYLKLIAARKMGKSPLYQQFELAMKKAISSIAPKVEPSTQLLMRGLQRGLLAVDLVSRDNIAACAEMAGLAYWQLLRFQEKRRSYFPIHRAQLNARKEDGTPYSHVFLILNAPTSFQDGTYQAEGSREHLRWIVNGARDHSRDFTHFANMYVLDPYFGDFSLLTNGRFMHTGLRTSNFSISRLPSYDLIAIAKTNKENAFGRFSGVFMNWVEQVDLALDHIKSAHSKRLEL